ncbi:MAG: hypothetical protein GTO51_00620 [Candidatus Latescibacteria bacterium]|nr:hypothetical protein [Candidatus Latescibacterota bacterium]NIM64485.1 hypothetical protein [Candidatus Latescibacterota bacterium]NIO00638.1 hypothetical protein [Candidatus Latescibacterota bacterium]NIO27041.1 hypothetical protein [Candidatus Latescibacterota bacterium]NIO54565.1 hypothetical protein [Candidatus Latescibacterota bacterium]
MLKSDSICLKKLYDFAWNDDRTGEALLQNSPTGRQYGKLARSVAEPVSLYQGIYMWGRYDEQRRWINLYIGRSGKGKSHLQGRIVQELIDDRNIFWEPIFTKRQLQEHCRRNYPGREDYVKNWDRALNRSRATHIVWVETGTALPKDIADIESELIEILNPRGNTQLPKPPKEAHDLTIEVIECFRKEINRRRFEKSS